MFKVFLGSTFKDLHEHRAAVQAAINRRDDCKAVVMEEFGARAGRPKEVCLEIAAAATLCRADRSLLRACAGRRGGLDHRGGVRGGGEKGLPRLLFLANEKFTPPAHIRESDEQYAKLQEFRARLMRRWTVQWFDNDREPWRHGSARR